MIRVAFAIEGQSWLGGINYFRNLFSALALLPDRKLHPIVFVSTQMPTTIFDNFRHAEIVRTKWLDADTPGAWLRRQTNKVTAKRDPLLTVLLARHKINVLSHAGPVWGSKTIGWIPDFQHLHLPEFFSGDDRQGRDAAFARIVSRCNCVLVSSKTAQRDLADFAPAAVSKSKVLHFVPEVDAAGGVVPLRDLQAKYGFDSPYFHVPNQFWVHKNHKVIIDALAILKMKGTNATVLSTGSTEDYRHPNHYSEMMSRVKGEDLAEAFRVLGTIPYGDMLSLMQHSCAVINPSLFEGWSSTVEEAKALDKTILLSNLPVHIEQNPAKGIFFDPASADDLAVKMIDALAKANSHPSVGADFTYAAAYKANRLDFARTYQDIVLDIMKTTS